MSNSDPLKRLKDHIDAPISDKVCPIRSQAVDDILKKIKKKKLKKRNEPK